MKSYLFAALFLILGGCPLWAHDHLPEKPEPGSSPWGPEDERGAANRMTPEKVLEAVKLIKKGQVYSLGREYDAGVPLVSGRSFVMSIPYAAAPAGENKIIGLEELITTQLGQVGTQLDGLGHVGIDDTFYNGHKHPDFVTPKGLTKLGVENVGVFMTRGILLDIAKLKDKERLEKGYEITADDLREALEAKGLEIHPGDFVLIHTGWGSLWKVDNELYNSGQPGIGVGAAKFLIGKEITMVGADNWGIEVHPGPDPEVLYPVHQMLLTQQGIYNLENLDTAQLAEDEVHEFAFFFAPLKLVGATGSPGNPVAIR